MDGQDFHISFYKTKSLRNDQCWIACPINFILDKSVKNLLSGLCAKPIPNVVKDV